MQFSIDNNTIRNKISYHTYLCVYTFLWSKQKDNCSLFKWIPQFTAGSTGVMQSTLVCVFLPNYSILMGFIFILRLHRNSGNKTAVNTVCYTKIWPYVKQINKIIIQTLLRCNETSHNVSKLTSSSTTWASA